MHHSKTIKINGTEFESARYIIGAQQNNWASLVAQTVKNLPAVQETRFNLWVRKIPWRRE